MGLLVDASIEPSSRFTAITGETGAGKTLLVGGLRLVLGEKPDPLAVGADDDHTQADGLFSDGDQEMGVTRIVPSDGKSRAHLDGSIVSAAVLSERVGQQVELVGQHDQLSLKKPSHVVAMLDSTLDQTGVAALVSYRETWTSYQELLKRQKLLGGDEMALRRELDLVIHQESEILGAALEPGSDSATEAEASRLRNSEEILEHLSESSRLAERLSDEAGEVVSRLRKVVELDPGAEGLVAQAEGVAADVVEMIAGLRLHGEKVDSDPGRLQEVDRRLTLIGDLKRKYGRTIGDILDFGRQATERAKQLAALLEEAGDIEQKIGDARAALAAAGAVLSQHRRDTAVRVQSLVVQHLSDMGLEGASVEFTFDPIEPGPGGAERMTFAFSSDARLEPGPISSVASGGELSRLVLAIRLATAASETQTLVFDEVDTGVGGATALAMGEKIAHLATDSQVLCVTHLPQVAAFADSHYVVERSDGIAEVRLVTGEERVAEISRMLAGLPESSAGQDAATELLEKARLKG